MGSNESLDTKIIPKSMIISLCWVPEEILIVLINIVEKKQVIL